jgi:hypothetical protein
VFEDLTSFSFKNNFMLKKNYAKNNAKNYAKTTATYQSKETFTSPDCSTATTEANKENKHAKCYQDIGCIFKELIMRVHI